MACLFLGAGSVFSCTLLISTGGLSGGSSNVIADGASNVTADGAPPTGDASTIGRRCDSRPPGLVLCEDFDNGFDISTIPCTSGTATLASATPFSPPNALQIRVTASNGACNRSLTLGAVATGVRLAFRARLETIGGRIHLFSLKVDADGGPAPFLYVNVYPDHIGLGEALPKGGGIDYADRATAYRPIPRDTWLDVVLQLDGLGSAPHASLVFDGTTLDAVASAVFQPGTGELIFGVNYVDTASALQLDDVQVVHN